MSLLYMDSFDHYATADVNEKWTASSSGGATLSITASNGRHTSGSFRLAHFTLGGAHARKAVPAADATAIVGCAYAINVVVPVANGTGVLAIIDGVTSQISLRLNQAMTLSVLRGSWTAGTVLGTTSFTLPVGSFTFLELKVLIHPSAGTVDLRANGVSILSLTGQNTRATGASQWTSVALGHFDDGGALGASFTTDWDDWYVLDGVAPAPWNAFLGDVRVDVRNMTAAGATTGWTPSAGSNFQNIDDAAPNDDTDFNSTTGVATDTFVAQDVPVAGSIIYGVQHCINVRKTDAGTCTVAAVTRHSGVDNVGADIAPGLTYAFGLQMNQTNPGTAAQWTESGFNNAEFGYKRTT